MCGLAGFLEPGGFSRSDSLSVIKRQAMCLEHRGPDDVGEWLDASAGIALGHRRLSILDLSSAGKQPMTSPSGRYVIAFNGEIYNHLEIRKELKSVGQKIAWNGHSDTETLLAAIEYWGIEIALVRCVGMFAFALWDCKDSLLTLARDRVGEKPLYYGWQNGIFLFGSELKALKMHPAFSADIDRRVLALYLRRGYIPAPHSIFKGISKVLPGTYIQLGRTAVAGFLPRSVVYWSFRKIARQGLANPIKCSDNEAVIELDVRLRKAVEMQSVADVPLGAFLSGGIDSSTIVALMQNMSHRPVRTFTIGFQESAFNEAKYAARIAGHLGTEHTELMVTPVEAMAVIPSLPHVFDEPFGDSSAIPTLLVSQLARQHVTVSLSGDGGDELFCGYSRYMRTKNAWQKVGRMPKFMRARLSALLRGVSRQIRPSSAGWKAERLSHYLLADQAADFYDVQISQRHDERDLILDNDAACYEPDTAFASGEFLDAMMGHDTLTYLPDDILTKVDRASMAVGLEARVPMLDHRVVEFAWRLPLGLKFRNGQAKWVLRQVLEKYVPKSHFERKKMGFSVPVGEWIRGPLRDWSESLLSKERLQREGIFNPELVRKQWAQHMEGAAYGSESLWQLLMFQEWLGSQASSTGQSMSGPYLPAVSNLK